MSRFTLAEGLARLESHSKLTAISIWSVIGFAALSAIGQALEALGLIDLATADASLAPLVLGFSYLGYAIAFLISVVVVSIWIYRAHANLEAAGLDDLEFSPGWSVGWFFVPIMNLFKPFQAMRELWNGSHGYDNSYAAPSSRELTLWWGAYIVGNILDSVSTRIAMMTSGDGLLVAYVLGIAGSLLTIVSAYYLLVIIRNVLDAQKNHISVSEAFA